MLISCLTRCFSQHLELRGCGCGLECFELHICITASSSVQKAGQKHVLGLLSQRLAACPQEIFKVHKTQDEIM